MHKEQNNNTTKTTTHDITWFTPSVGVMSIELCFIQLSLQVTVLIYALSCRSFQVLKAMHTAVGLYTHSCKSPNLFTNSSMHIAAEVNHAHS